MVSLLSLSLRSGTTALFPQVSNSNCSVSASIIYACGASTCMINFDGHAPNEGSNTCSLKLVICMIKPITWLYKVYDLYCYFSLCMTNHIMYKVVPFLKSHHIVYLCTTGQYLRSLDSVHTFITRGKSGQEHMRQVLAKHHLVNCSTI